MQGIANMYRQFLSTKFRAWKKGTVRSTVLMFFFVLLMGAFMSTRWINASFKSSDNVKASNTNNMGLKKVEDSFKSSDNVKASNPNNMGLKRVKDSFKSSDSDKALNPNNMGLKRVEDSFKSSDNAKTSNPNNMGLKNVEDSFKSSDSVKASNPNNIQRSQRQPRHASQHPKRVEIPFTCPSKNQTKTCPINLPSSSAETHDGPTPPVCPDYFRWIHEDLRPWKTTGISREMVERANRTANFRLVILKGRAYVEKYSRPYQTRDVFTLWGILQLLRRYPGRLPDLELMFDCVDWPVVKARDYKGKRGKGKSPPPVFRYCADDETLDIVFPDWSFWGWAEINIKPWENLLKELKAGNERMKWIEKEPYAYWKGNPTVAATRLDLLKCNVSEAQDWNARIYAQDWFAESQQGFKKSDLANQCNYRYKIYIEGSAWSVSEKYILACNSVTLLVKPRYYDFFTRGLMPVHHYWPVRDEDKCRSIKFAVDWGNSHKQKAQAMGKAASSFIQEELKMDYVYDYMLHLLSEYAKLLTYTPTVPPKAVEFCSESMACPARGSQKQFMMESMVKSPTDSRPCTLPPPFDPLTLASIVRRKGNSLKQVEKWEKGAWESRNDKV